MKPLKTGRAIDQIVYDQFKVDSFWKDALILLSNKNIKIIVDVGASSGIATLLFLELPQVERVYCFEPDETNFELLSRNVGDYKRVLIHNIGIYYGITESNVVGIGDNSPLGYMVENATKEHDYCEGTIRYKNKKFKLTTLESTVNLPVDLVKLDVEGSEYNIIENSTLLKQSKYLIVSFHNHPKDYVKDFIAENLQEYTIIYFKNLGMLSDVLMERS